MVAKFPTPDSLKCSEREVYESKHIHYRYNNMCLQSQCKDAWLCPAVPMPLSVFYMDAHDEQTRHPLQKRPPQSTHQTPNSDVQVVGENQNDVRFSVRLGSDTQTAQQSDAD
jgi:hypothetical protein